MHGGAFAGGIDEPQYRRMQTIDARRVALVFIGDDPRAER